MSSNSFIWVKESGDLGTADWVAKPAAAPACVCRLHTVAVRQVALVSDESALEACLRQCAIQIDHLYLFTTWVTGWRHTNNSNNAFDKNLYSKMVFSLK